MPNKLDFPYSAPPPEGTATEVAPGVHWLRLPLPFQLDHVNVWLIEDAGGWTLVDTGIANDETRALWCRLAGTVLAGRPIRRVVGTHFHPDHMGLAGWFAAEQGAALWTTQTEWLVGRLTCLDRSAELVDNNVDFYRRVGFTEAELRLVRERGNSYADRVVPVPPTLRRIAAGEVIEIGGRGWRVMVGEGHAPEHACLHCSELGVLISGDQILPRISPNIGVWPNEPLADPLGLYLAALGQFEGLPADLLVLPSHGLPFRRLPLRIAQLRHHHAVRLEHSLAACVAPVTAATVMAALFAASTDPHQAIFAASETLAHLHRLIAEGAVTREQRSDGVWLFLRAG